MREIIQRAVSGGYNIPYKDFEVWKDGTVLFISEEGEAVLSCMMDTEKIIFSHEFLKAYFGEEMVCENCGEIDCECFWKSNMKIAYLPEVEIVRWAYYAQQLVLSEDRIQYLKNFLK